MAKRTLDPITQAMIFHLDKLMVISWSCAAAPGDCHAASAFAFNDRINTSLEMLRPLP